MLTCIAKITAQDAHKNTVKQELMKLLVPTRAEKGCVNYDMHVDNNADNIFIFHENWLTEADLDAHLESTHIKNCFDLIGNLVESVDVNRLSKI